MAEPFRTVKSAARALIDHPQPDLNRRSGSFIGQLLFDSDAEDLSERQARWLQDLLKKHGLPPLADGGEA
ncbi:hypothetical protein [Sphingomonas adhaesiva]|uniref:hypothetical protein n=1 Tax=Sphingomonas adhaesiva TaxID=28212 RepID=UPI002FFC4D5B